MRVLAVRWCVSRGLLFEHGIPQDVLREKTKDAGVTDAPGSFRALVDGGASTAGSSVSRSAGTYCLLSMVMPRPVSMRTAKA